MMKKPIKTAMPKMEAGSKKVKPLLTKQPLVGRTSTSTSTANGRRAVN
jgi:hypothetical protein